MQKYKKIWQENFKKFPVIFLIIIPWIPFIFFKSNARETWCVILVSASWHLLFRITAHPRGAFISVGDWTPTEKYLLLLTTCRSGSLNSDWDETEEGADFWLNQNILKRADRQEKGEKRMKKRTYKPTKAVAALVIALSISGSAVFAAEKTNLFGSKQWRHAGILHGIQCNGRQADRYAIKTDFYRIRQ